MTTNPRPQPDDAPPPHGRGADRHGQAGRGGQGAGHGTDGPRPYEPVRFGRSPLHRIPTVSVLALAVIILIVASTTRGPVRWLMMAVVLVAALSAWRSYRIRQRLAAEDADGTARTTDPDGTDPGRS